jgi:hypothetical protein
VKPLQSPSSLLLWVSKSYARDINRTERGSGGSTYASRRYDESSPGASALGSVRHFFVTLLVYFPTKRSIQGGAVDLGGRRSTLGCAAIFSREGVVKALIDPENEL